MIITDHVNGNARVVVHDDGTRVVSWPDGESLSLDFPLNVDVRLSGRCSFGAGRDGRPGVCSFCHESATRDGEDGDVESLIEQLSSYPSGTEVAVGVNTVDDRAASAVERMTAAGMIVSATVNMGHVRSHAKALEKIVASGVRGLGISYRRAFSDKPIPDFVRRHPGTVLHVIAGIDSVDEVRAAERLGFERLLVLGEKDFGFNRGRVDTGSESHRRWRQGVRGLVNRFRSVSFDNLALEQLGVRRFVRPETWVESYQGEMSVYLDSVTRETRESSRSSVKSSWSDEHSVSFFRRHRQERVAEFELNRHINRG